MKILYLDCSMGAAGDMFCAALLELIEDKEAALEAINNAGIPGVSVSLSPSKKCGITGSHFSVSINSLEESSLLDRVFHRFVHRAQHHRSAAGILALVEKLKLPESVKDHTKGVYQSISAAECKVHGGERGHVHLHEVGAMDAVADITMAALLLDMLQPDKIVVSPIHVGSGTVRCAHGVVPLPAPATALLLVGLPVYSNGIKGELCTPTGAALLKHFAHEFGEMPMMTINAIGYGMGKKDFEQANCLRAIWGESIN